DADRVPGVLPARRDQRRAAPALLCEPVPGGGGGQHLLRAALREQRAALVAAHAPRLRVPRQGVPALHPAPDAAAGAPAGPARAARRAGEAAFSYRALPPDIVDELWRRFALALEPLRASGRLGAIVFQFAPWMQYAEEHFDHIARCAE